MEHMHQFSPDGITEVVCECGLRLRLATYDEAVMIHATGATGPDGPLVWRNNMVVVPLDFSLFQEA